MELFVRTHGLQHYEETQGAYWGSLEEIQSNDKDKEELAKENGIDNYIVIDCRLSDMEFIRNSILKSDLPNLLNFKMEDIDWLKCHEWACNSLVKVVCDLWSGGIKNVTKIVEESKISKSTVIKYLHRGVELGWCDYDPIEESRKSGAENKRVLRKVICTTT